MNLCHVTMFTPNPSLTVRYAYCVNTCCNKCTPKYVSMCSFRVDSILKWRVYIKLKVS